MQGLMMEYPLTIDRLLEHANRLFSHKRVTTMLPDGTLHRYTYGEMYSRVKRLSKALVKLGVEPGDRVGTFAWNNYQHLELYYAIPGAGAVCHTLNIRLFPDQLAFIVNHASDKILFIDASLLPLYERVSDQIDCVEKYVLMNASEKIETKLRDVLYYEDLISDSDDDFQWRSTEENMAMGLCYTSGTTGDPKGVLYSHRSMFLHSLGSNQAGAIGVKESDVVLPVVPQFHAMAWGLPYSCPMAGAELIMPGSHLQSKPLAQLISSESVTIAAGVPTIWTALYHELEEHPQDISKLRALVVGGSAMPRSLIASYEDKLDVNVLHAWGMTEMSPLGTVSILLSHHENLAQPEKWDIKAKQGYPIAGVEMRIRDEMEQELPWDGAHMGELQVRGPWVARQYFRREPAEEHFTSDGWFRTGDVVTVSADGYMQIMDRTKDLVKSGGEWISSVELENALMAHPKVMEAAVIAVPDEKWAERPLAAVVPVEGARDLSGNELKAFLVSKVAKFWMPDTIVFIDEIPKTSVGKFNKKVLREQYQKGKLG